MTIPLRQVSKIIVLVSLAFFCFSQVFFSLHESQNIDEGVHISAGLSYWKTGDFRLNPEHPPLAKLLATLPLLFTQVQLPIGQDSWLRGDEWGFADTFMYGLGNSADNVLLLTRIPIILMSVATGIFLVLWAYSIAGWNGAALSSVLFASSPVVLTHSHYVTTDMPLTLGFIAAAWFLRKVLLSGSLRWIIFFAFSVAFASSVKFTGLVLFPITIVAYLIYWFAHPHTHCSIRHFGKVLVWCFLVTFLFTVVITFGSFQKATQDPFAGDIRLSELESSARNDRGVTRIVSSASASILRSVPLPAYPYWIGLLSFARHYSTGHDTYFFGMYSRMGTPWYFPAAFILKSPLSICILITLLFIVFVKKTLQTIQYQIREGSLVYKIREWLGSVTVDGFILFLFILIFFIFSIISTVNIGIRHILPIFPLIFIGIARLLTLQLRFSKLFKACVWSITVLGMVNLAIAWPFPMGHFNEVIGSSKNGRKYLMDSNIDWGQNIKYVKAYMVKNSLDHICYSFFGKSNITYEGIDGRYLPPITDTEAVKDIDCFVAISVQSLYSKDGEYAWLWKYAPTKIIGNAIYLYDLRKK